MKSVEGGQFLTRSRKASFTFDITPTGVAFTPATGKVRPVSTADLQKVCDHFARTGSFRPGDYQSISFHASYLLAMIDQFLCSSDRARIVTTSKSNTDEQPRSLRSTFVKPQNQVIGNIGLFYVCYHLSRQGWNVMPTTRNARGIDVLIYSQDNVQKYSIQVKALSRGNPVPLGKRLDGLWADFFVICRGVTRDSPECFILLPSEVRELAHRGEKDGRVSFWLQPSAYTKDSFCEAWDRIGKGILEST